MISAFHVCVHALKRSASMAQNAGILWMHHSALGGISARLPNQLMCTSVEICTVSVTHLRGCVSAASVCYILMIRACEATGSGAA